VVTKANDESRLNRERGLEYPSLIAAVVFVRGGLDDDPIDLG
jgi:hypothetical protein